MKLLAGMSADGMLAAIGWTRARGWLGYAEGRPPSRILPALAVACAAGVLLALAYAHEPVWWAAWLAPALGLTAVILAPRRARLWLGLFVGVVGSAALLPYYALTAANWPIAIALVAGRSVLWMWMFRIAARAAERLRPEASIFVLPSLLMAAETLITRLSPHGAAGSLAYSQMELLPLLQVASLAGTGGISFVVGLGASAAGLVAARALGWCGREGLRLAAAIAISLVLAAVGFGQTRLATASSGTNGLEVVLIAQNRLGGDPADVGGFWRAYGAQLTNAAQPGRILILPEAILILPQPTVDVIAKQLASLARDRQTTIVVGFIVEHDQLITNRALIAQPNGNVTWYSKQRLVPVLEKSISPGRIPSLFNVKGTRAGVAICKDMHFPSLGLKYARQGADLMLVPANDFVVDGWMASRMTAMRGVEGGFAVARTARNGRLTISDRYGRILADRASSPGMTTLISRLPVIKNAGRTIFVRFAEILDLLSVATAAGLLWIMRRKS